MDRQFTRFTQNREVDQIVDHLSEQQHLRPHHALADAVGRAQLEAGYCLEAAQHAIQTLALDPQSQIGRLKRTEIVQLAKAIYRIWKQGLGTASTSVSFHCA